MEIILAACLVLASEGEAAEWEHLAPAYERFRARDYEGAIEEFTRLSEQAAAESRPRLRVEAIIGRASAHVWSGNTAAAIADFTTAIQLAPDDPRAYCGRADAYEQQGDFRRAAVDRERAMHLLTQGGWDGFGAPYGGYAVEAGPFASGVLLVGAWFVVTVIYLVAARKQRDVGDGSIWRWLWVSAAAAALALLPCATWAFCARVLDVDYPDSVRAIYATIPSAFFVCLFMSPPGQIPGAKRRLPFVDDGEFLARVEDLARRMGVAPPRVQLSPSIGGALATQAAAGGLPAPSLIVTDGLLHRLSSAERDVVVAHELAHLSAGSLWLMAAVGPIACTAAALFGGEGLAWIAFGAALFMGLRRIVNRPMEIRCDRRAAEAIGHPEMASALAKIEAVHRFPSPGWLEALIHATATHPSLEARQAALARRAPAEERAEIDYSETTARRNRLLSWAALWLWLGSLAAGAILTHFAARPHLAFALLAAVTMTPQVLCLLGLQPHWSRARRLLRGSIRWGTAFRFVLVGAAVLVLIADCFGVFEYGAAEFLPGISIYFIASIVLLVAAFSWPNRSGKLLKEVRIALQLHEFERVLELGRAKPKIVARNHLLRHNMALAAELTGDRQRAIAELEQLRHDKPWFKLPWLVLGALYLDEGQPERALALAEQTERELRKDPTPPLLAAQALQRLGRLDEAQAALDRTLAIEPLVGEAHALAARIALDRTSVSQAEALIERAHQLAPGDAYVLVVQAWITVARGDAEPARRAVEQAIEAVRANPFALLSREVAALQERLETLEAGGMNRPR